MARKLRTCELPLVKALLDSAGLKYDVSTLLVEEMNDGGMGSLRFVSDGADAQRFGAEVAEFEFSDSDGVAVIACLNLDEHGRLFELDMLRLGPGKLIRYPEFSDLRPVNYVNR